MTDELAKANAEIAKLKAVIAELEGKMTRRSHATLSSLLADIHQPTDQPYLDYFTKKYPRLNVVDELENAWDHSARKKRKDMGRYCDNWLRKTDDRKPRRAGEVHEEVVRDNRMAARSQRLREEMAQRERAINEEHDPDYVRALLKKEMG